MSILSIKRICHWKQVCSRTFALPAFWVPPDFLCFVHHLKTQGWKPTSYPGSLLWRSCLAVYEERAWERGWVGNLTSPYYLRLLINGLLLSRVSHRKTCRAHSYIYSLQTKILNQARMYKNFTIYLTFKGKVLPSFMLLKLVKTQDQWVLFIYNWSTEFSWYITGVLSSLYI
jgi:hypothetical protein